MSNRAANDSTFPAFFRLLIVWVLLALYTGMVAYMTYRVVGYAELNDDDARKKERSDKDADGKLTMKEFHAGITTIAATVGGLISALVVATLAITKPGYKPMLFRTAADDGSGDDSKERTRLENVTAAYLFVWLATGLTALVVGTLIYPDASKTLAGIGSGWLGLATAAGFAYFGLKLPDTSLMRAAGPRAGGPSAAGPVRIVLTVDVDGAAVVEPPDHA